MTVVRPSDECVWTRLSDGVFRIGCCGRTATGRIPDTGPSVCSACHNPVRVADTLTSNEHTEFWIVEARLHSDPRNWFPTSVHESEGDALGRKNVDDREYRRADHRVSKLVRCTHETREPPRQLELTNELRWILGRPCFMVIPMVQCLRKMGRHIDTKAEDEQAVAIHWMLSLYLEHGADKWRDEAEKILKEGQRQANELKAEGGET